MKKKLVLIFSIIVGIIILLGITCFAIYKKQIGPVNEDKTVIEFVVPEKATYSTLGALLERNGLIKSELFYKIYIKLHNQTTTLKAGTYYLSKDMGVEKILKELSTGGKSVGDIVTITFKEGLNMRQIATLISEKTNNKYEDVFTLLEDQTYLDELISTYWFITDDIKNANIYYSLEGYLFPDTYQFNADVDVKGIFKVLLEQMGKELETFKDKIDGSNYSIHQILTLASIVELEGARSDDRKGVAGVFYNRLNNGYNLGSDVTTYYATKKTFQEELTYNDLNDCNSYNTRGSCVNGLPVGPIANPSYESIDATINPTVHNYFYFVADKNGKTYFNTNYSGHQQTITKLKNENLWYEYK